MHIYIYIHKHIHTFIFFRTDTLQYFRKTGPWGGSRG